MTLMLQKKSLSYLVSALAFAALATPAMAQSCDLSDGFDTAPHAFSLEADACLEGLNGVDYDRALERELLEATNERRSAKGNTGVDYLESLRMAARLHAMDMAVRNYAAHDDLEGRSHLDRVRLLDRSVLIGSSGANIVVLGPDATASDIFSALESDAANRGNMDRSNFTNAGIGIAKTDKQTIVVQLFAAIDGRLAQSVPLLVADTTDLSASFADSRLQPVGWRLTDASGEIIDRGLGTKMTPHLAPGQSAYLTVDVAYRTSEYALRGPLITAQ